MELMCEIERALRRRSISRLVLHCNLLVCEWIAMQGRGGGESGGWRRGAKLIGREERWARERPTVSVYPFHSILQSEIRSRRQAETGWLAGWLCSFAKRLRRRGNGPFFSLLGPRFREVKGVEWPRRPPSRAVLFLFLLVM
jgi:hypothetical protein